MAFARLLRNVRDGNYVRSSLKQQMRVKLSDRSVLAAVGFLLTVPTVAHLLFSWMGFNPTDDGFTLAYSRRILEGQVPHRDFIIIRPFLSPLIHTPFVLFGGEYTYWVSRFFVWFQFAFISWAWVSVINRAFGYPFNNTTKLFVALVSFVASINLFTLTAWHTTDGIFLTSIGIWVLATQRHPTKGVVGYSLIATAYLCKQSFFLMAPISVLLLGDWREKKYWLAIAAPGAAYCIYLLATGAFSEAILQLTAQTGIVSVGVESYLNYAVLLGALGGYCSIFLLNTKAVLSLRIKRVLRHAGTSILIVMPTLFVAIGLYLARISTVSYGVFGMVLGVALYYILSKVAWNKDKLTAALLVLLLAWSASLSVGANSPLLALGPLLTLLVAFAYSMRQYLDFRVLQTTLVVMGVAILLSFSVSRPHHIYYERPFNELSRSLGGVLPGGRLIYTNPNTYEFMANLNEAIDIVSARNREYAIIPDVPGYWVQARQTNPLPIDWLFPVELGNQQLAERVIRDLEDERGETIIIAQKVDAFFLADDSRPVDEKDYPVLKYVRTHFNKTHETEFFELYE